MVKQKMGNHLSEFSYKYFFFFYSPVFSGLFDFCSIYTGASLEGAVRLNQGVGEK